MDHAVDLAPFERYPAYKRGRYYAEAERWDEAEADLLRAIRIEKNYLIAHQTLHHVYSEQERFDEVIAICDTTLTKDLHPDVRAALESAKRRAVSFIEWTEKKSVKE